MMNASICLLSGDHPAGQHQFLCRRGGRQETDPVNEQEESRIEVDQFKFMRPGGCLETGPHIFQNLHDIMFAEIMFEVGDRNPVALQEHGEGVANLIFHLRIEVFRCHGNEMKNLFAVLR